MIFRFWASFWTLLSDFLFCESSLDCYENLELDILLLFALWPTCFIWEVFRTVSPFKNSFFLHNMLLVAYHKTKSKKKSQWKQFQQQLVTAFWFKSSQNITSTYLHFYTCSHFFPQTFFKKWKDFVPMTLILPPRLFMKDKNLNNGTQWLWYHQFLCLQHSNNLLRLISKCKNYKWHFSFHPKIP